MHIRLWISMLMTRTMEQALTHTSARALEHANGLKPLSAVKTVGYRTPPWEGPMPHGQARAKPLLCINFLMWLRLLLSGVLGAAQRMHGVNQRCHVFRRRELGYPVA